MIAALVFIALAATAQAYPGNHALVVSEHDVMSTRLGADPDVFCLMKYIDPIKKIVESAVATATPAKALVSDLVTEVKACEGNILEKFECDLQAVRNTWQNSATLRNSTVVLYDDAVKLALEIKTECFKSKSA